MSTMVSTKGLNKADVVAALYNAARPQGLGFMQYDPKPMTREEAEELLKHESIPDGRVSIYFDYLKGRVLKVDLSSDDEFNPAMYDRGNGPCTAELVIEHLRRENNTNPMFVEALHVLGTKAAAKEARKEMCEQTEIADGTIRIGLADVADVLRPAVDRATEK